MRGIGEIYLELEELINEAIDDHDVQWGGLIYWLHGHLKIHRPDAQEEFLDGTNPVLYYGCMEDLREKLQGKVNKNKK